MALQDFEIPRREAAFKAFSEQFAKGVAEGESQLASKNASPLTDVPSLFPIDVPCTKVLDNLWQPFLQDFREAGRRAALAVRGITKPMLDESEATEGSEPAFRRNVYRWWVRLT